MALPIIGALRLLAVRSRVAGFALRTFSQFIIKSTMRDNARDRYAMEARRIVGRLLRSIRVNVDSRATSAWLTDIQRRKIPLATAMALTRTAKALQKILETEVTRVFDKPVPFTKRAFAVRPATRSNLQSEVFIKTRQAEYLLPQIAGGRRKPKRFEQRFSGETGSPDSYWVAGEGTRLNAAGNISLATVKKIAAQLKKARRDVFFGKPSPALPFGVWERTGKRGAVAGLRPILVQIKAPSYRKRLDLDAIAARHAQPIFKREFDRAWREIIR
jgi:hypothetical protein